MSELQLQTFQNEQFGEVRAISRDSEPWFIAADVCAALELGQVTNSVRRLDEDEKALISIKGLTKGNDQVNIINEAGLYSLVLGSRKPEAKQFKRWITHEVIPSIRKTGGYIAGQETLSDADLLAKAVLVAQRQIEEKNKLIETMTPKAFFADAVSSSQTSILIGDLAKLLKQNGVNIGQKRLFTWLRENGYLIRQGCGSYNMPTQKAMDMGLFDVKETVITHSDGRATVSKTARVTGKGQVYFINKLAPKAEVRQ